MQGHALPGGKESRNAVDRPQPGKGLGVELNLPLILAGPILRRVETRSVSVWMAVSSASVVHVDVYEGLADAGAPSGSLASVHADPVASGTLATRPVGKSLHIAVVTADTAGGAPLLPGHLYSYNVTVTAQGAAGAADLNSAGLLVDVDRFQRALGYQNGVLPGFATCPERTEDLVLMHGSCQKPHGLGAPMQAQFDAAIEAARLDPVKRPHRLFLTGDQIYADDVATCLLPGLADLGKLLLGATETVKGPDASDKSDATIVNFPAGRRARLAAIAGMTQEEDEGRNHLMSLGEWCALYLIAFSPDCWPLVKLAKAHVPDTDAEKNKLIVKLLAQDAADKDATDADAPEVLAPPPKDDGSPLESSLADIFPGDPTAESQAEIDRKTKLLDDIRDQFLKQKRAILGKTPDAKIHQRADTANFRRALANVPTYMQFDDHDCTDDWFITAEWRDRVLGNLLGQTIVRNALVAGTMFQAWGNDPAAWSSGDRADLLVAIGRLFADGASTGPDDAACVAINTILGLNPGALPKFDFSYKVDGPTHRVVVLDTRTRREYQTPTSPPGLLSAASLDEQLPPGPLPSGLEVLVVISPAPVLGPALITDFAQPGLIAKVDFGVGMRWKEQRRKEEAETGIPGGRVPGAFRWDLEQWHVNPDAFERLLERLSTYPRVVVLAGDVHYGAAFTMAYGRLDDPRVSRIVHFTSSAMRNAWDRPFPEIMNHDAWSRVLQRFGLPKRQLAWKTATPGVLADEPIDERLSLRGRLRRSPVLLPDQGWRNPHALTRSPDWVWELDEVRDERPSSERPAVTRPPQLTEPDIPPLPLDPPAPAPPAPPIELLHPAPGQLGYARLAQVHQAALGQSVARGLQFLNNIGKITFARSDDGKLSVSQTLVSLRDKPEDDDKPDGYIVHATSLEPTPPTVPARIGEQG